jgi:hypothetical protein
VHRCGIEVCVVVNGSSGQQLWRFDPATGSVTGKAPVSLPQGAGDDALLAGADHDRDLSTFIVASRGPVEVGQYSSSGDHLDWSVLASTLFGDAAVGPNGGWEGWSSSSGWVIWLGLQTPANSPRPEAGNVLPRGAVAGVSSTGVALWLRNDRHPCFFLAGDVPTLCDGDLRIVSTTSAEARPSKIEGVDTTTGQTTWTVDLAGTIDEYDTSGQVLHVDDMTYLVATPAGLTRIDLTDGPQPTADANQIGWCQPDRNVHDDIDQGTQTRSYIRSTGHYPCLGGQPVDEPAAYPVPNFAGVNAGGWSAWIVDSHVHGRRQTS